MDEENTAAQVKFEPHPAKRAPIFKDVDIREMYEKLS